MSGSQGAYWVRPVSRRSDTIQHSLWLFDTEAEARVAKTVFSSLRDMRDACGVRERGCLRGHLLGIAREQFQWTRRYIRGSRLR